MSINAEEIGQISELARIALSEEEKELFSKQLSGVLRQVGAALRVDTEEIPPTSHVVAGSNVLRNDEVLGSLPVEEALSNARQVEQHAFKVPKIV